jgi:LmbE family N-acetylglucosaminyl deacetylase
MRKQVPLFWKIFAVVAAAALLALAAVNIYIRGRLAEYEAAQPKYVAQVAYDRYFAQPDFGELMDLSGYELAPGESRDDVIAYFSALFATGHTEYVQVTSAFESNPEALAYVVIANGVNAAKFTLVPSGQRTKHGSVIYAPGELMLIRRQRPAPPEQDPAAAASLAEYSGELQAKFSLYVITAAKMYSLRSRSKAPTEAVLPYYEPGTDIYERIRKLSYGYEQVYDSYHFDGVLADEFTELGGGAFSCRVRYDFVMTKDGKSDYVDRVDYRLYLRPDENGKHLIYGQHVTGMSPETAGIAPVIASVLAARVTVDDGAATALTDGSPKTRKTFADGDSLSIAADEKLKYLYLIWDTPPTDAVLSLGGTEVALGGHGFLHELVTLERGYDASSVAAELQFRDKHTLCDVYAFGLGQLPDWVQAWEPPLDKADLLVLPTHADDEFIMFGGVLPTYAGERQLAVQVVYLTHHREINPLREHERLDGLWTVGVTAYPVVGPFPDTGLTKDSLEAAATAFGRDAVLEFQVRMLRRFKPGVVVGHDLKGEYGHGAHRLNAVTLTEALELSGDPLSYPQMASAYGVWDVPKTYLHLYRGDNTGEIVMDWNIPLTRFGGKTAYEMAVEGFAKHVTQTNDYTVRQEGGWHDSRRFGLFRSTVGPDTEMDDFFEHIQGIG